MAATTMSMEKYWARNMVENCFICYNLPGRKTLNSKMTIFVEGTSNEYEHGQWQTFLYPFQPALINQDAETPPTI